MIKLKKILLILLITSLCGLGQAYGDAEVDQDVDVDILPAVNITKTAESIESGTVNPSNGNITGTGLKSVFTLQTNGTDDDYEFVISSTIMIQDDTISGYSQSGGLLFGNTTVLPTRAAAENAKARGTNNNNIIVYPVTVIAEGDMVPEFHYNNATYGDYYKIYVNGDQEQRKITHTVSTTPDAGSYNVAHDEAGSYQAIVTFSSIAK